jgi:hypothetical protein
VNSHHLIKIDISASHIKDSQLELLFENNIQVEHLNLYKLPSLPIHAILRVMLPKNNKIELLQIFRSWTRVKSVTIKDCKTDDLQVQWSRVKLPLLRKLTSLVLHGCQWLYSEALTTIAISTRALISLELNNCNFINDVAVAEMGALLPQLETLK